MTWLVLEITRLRRNSNKHAFRAPNSSASSIPPSTYISVRRDSNHYYIRNTLKSYQKRGTILRELSLPTPLPSPPWNQSPPCPSHLTVPTRAPRSPSPPTRSRHLRLYILYVFPLPLPMPSRTHSNTQKPFPIPGLLHNSLDTPGVGSTFSGGSLFRSGFCPARFFPALFRPQ